MIFQNKNKRFTSTKGFSLIELAVALVVLGILFSVVTPKLLSLTKDATESQVKTTGTAFYEGIKLARTVWIANGASGPADDLPVYSNSPSGSVDFNANGWPAQHHTLSPQANPTLDNVGDCMSVWKIILQASTTVANDNSADYRASYVTPGKCKFENTLNTAYKIEYDSNNGEVDITIP